MKYPSINAKVYIEGNCFRGGIVEMFARAGCRGEEDPEKADLLVFSGGSDISPNLYGHKQHRSTSPVPGRDQDCELLFGIARSLGTPMFGICRGMQFLHAMAGGTLIQDVRNHHGSHDIRVTGRCNLLPAGSQFRASSIHHQMCQEEPDICVPLAYAAKTGHSGYYTYWDSTHNQFVELTSDRRNDLEAAAYPHINAAAVQGHPELLDDDMFVRWTLNVVNKLVHEGLTTNSIQHPPQYIAGAL